MSEKRRRVDSGAVVAKPRLFSPFRTIGQTTSALPFAIGTLGATFYVVTSIGRSFQIYDANTLHLLFISQGELSAEITSLTAHYHHVYAAYGNTIGVFKRGKLEHSMECNSVKKMLVFGEYLVAASESNITVFKKPAGVKVATELYTTLAIQGDIVDLIHPPTYLNKVVVLTTTAVHIINIHSGQLLFSAEFPYTFSTIETAPVLDTVAIGTTGGEVLLYNIKKGKIFRTLTTGQSITSLSFRTDGPSHLVCGHASGELSFYDLDRMARIHILQAHRETHGGCSNVKFLNGQPILVSNGGDNQLKEFVFDPSLSSNAAVVSPPRFLRSRGGHAAPVTQFTFADPEGHYIVSGSQDRTMWKFSLRKDAQSQELSQRPHKTAKPTGGSKEKFPQVIDLAIENTRVGEWANVVSAHQGEVVARTWDAFSKRVGPHKLPTVDNGLIKAVAMSPCGNFALVGSSNGGIGVYNLQSGILRKKYLLHKKAVTGVALDGMNRKMVSCGLDGIVGFYDFSDSKYLGKLVLSAPITTMIFHRTSDLFAMALDDLSIVVIDSVTQRVIRVFWGHSNRITSLDFSPDGRWIVSSSLDSTVRTWDIPSGSCIDGLKLSNVATNVRFSPNGEFLATTHVSKVGIHLWTNRSQFRPVPLRNIEEDEFLDVSLTSMETSLLDGALNTEEEEQQHHAIHYETKDQIDVQLMTLSLEPRSKFTTLLNLDTIKQRNKPKEAPKKPKNAPFFLQASKEAVGDDASVREGKSVILNNEEDEDTDNGLHVLRPMNGSFESDFTKLLRTGSQSQDYSAFLQFLSTASPSITDLEIKSIDTTTLTEITYFIKALTQSLSTNTNIELSEAWMSMLLKNHGDVLHNVQDEECCQALDDWYEGHKDKTNSFDELIKYCSGVVNLLSTV